MRFAEVNVLGVYVAPIAPMLLLAWLLMLPLRRAADYFGLFRFVWHPALFLCAAYVIVLSAIVLLAGGVFG